MLLLAGLQVYLQKVQDDLLIHPLKFEAHFMTRLFALVLDNFIYGSVPVHFEDELFGAVELDYGPESINDKIQQIPQPPKLFLQGFPVSKFAQERQERLRLRPILDGLVGYRRECSQ